MTHPELAKQAVGWDPSNFTQGSDKKQVWNCQKGHQYVSSIGSQVRGTGCGVCAGTQIIVGVNDLGTTHPELSARLVGLDPKTTRNIYDCLVNDVHPSELIIKTENPNLDILPSHIDLVGAELEMINMEQREYRLKEALAKIKDQYDFIIIDCSPSLGLITVNSLTAADSVLIPVQCEYFALEGLGKLLNTIKIVQGRLNPDLEIEGIVLTMYDTRLRLANQVVDEVKTHFQELVFDTVIHRNTKLGEAPSFGETIVMHDASSKGAINYLNFAREILQKNNMTKIANDDKKINLGDDL